MDADLSAVIACRAACERRCAWESDLLFRIGNKCSARRRAERRDGPSHVFKCTPECLRS